MKNQINYNVTGSDRKQFVSILTRETGIKATYKGMPSMAYEIGGLTVDKSGCLTWTEDTDNATILKLAEALDAAGFEPEEPVSLEAETSAEPEEATSTDEAEGSTTEPATQEAESADAAESDETGLTISLPLDGFNPDSLDLLQKLVDSRSRLIRKAVGADQLTIRTSDGKVEFPWWNSMPTPEETQAYMSFIVALCAKAKEAKRVLATDREVESEKFTFRTFLLSLGFIGDEYKAARRILMKPLTGTAAFPTKAAADAFSAAQKAKREAAKAAAQAEAEEAAPEAETTEQAEEVETA